MHIGKEKGAIRMYRKLGGMAFCIAGFVISAAAQTSGVINAVPLLLSVSPVPVSAQQGAYVGWNNLTGSTGETDFINNQGNGPGGFAFINTPSSGSPSSTLMFLNGYGDLGIGTTSPTAPLDVATGTVSAPQQVYNAIVVQPAGGSAQGANGASIFLDSVTNGGINPIAGIWSSLWSGGNGGLTYNGALVFGTTRMGNSAPVEGMRLDQDGNVGIGTVSPGARLEVNGNVKLSSGSGASITFADNTVQSTAWTGTLCGGDYAETMDVSGERKGYEPGDVLMLDPNTPGNVLRVTEPYSTLVAGIYSTKPGVVGRRQTTDPKASTTEVPMAMVGVVPTKVSTENGSIKVGDLLVTSSTPGHAMKGTDRTRLIGAIVGKAMGNLESGTGVIEVLVSLQ
jgi:hypothetical protein